MIFFLLLILIPDSGVSFDRYFASRFHSRMWHRHSSTDDFFSNTGTVDKKVAKVTLSFYKMVDRLAQYSMTEIESLENERLKHLVYGGKEALSEGQIVMAFCVLYEDFLPIRFGGDILFNMLEKAINSGRNKNKNTLPNEFSTKPSQTSTTYGNIVPQTKQGLGFLQRKIVRNALQFSLQQQQQEETTCVVQNLFDEIDQNGDNNISIEEFESWISSVVVTDEEEKSSIPLMDQLDENDKGKSDLKIDPEILFQEADTNKDGTLSLDEFRIWTTGLQKNCDLDDDSDQDSTSTSASASAPNTVYTKSLTDIPLSSPGNKRHRERYLNMVRNFSEWGANLPAKFTSAEEDEDKSVGTGIGVGTPSELITSLRRQSELGKGRTNTDGRIELVVSGCFLGARNPGVVKALGILYEDYPPLRLAGDIVFKLVESRIAKQA